MTSSLEKSRRAAALVEDVWRRPERYGTCQTCRREDVLLQVAGPRVGQLTLHNGPDGVRCLSDDLDETPPAKRTTT